LSSAWQLDNDNNDNDDDVFVVVVPADLLTEYIMLSPWRHIQNSRHYNIKGLSFVMPWEKSRWCVVDGDASQYATAVR
jgi:hypothetical protein